MNRIKAEILERTESQESKFYGINRNGSERFELRLDDGNRISLPYHHLQDVRFDVEEGTDLIQINLPGLYLVQVRGRGLTPIYEALHRGQINFIAYNSNHIDPDQNGVLITSMDAWQINDPLEQFSDEEN